MPNPLDAGVAECMGAAQMGEAISESGVVGCGCSLGVSALLETGLMGECKGKWVPAIEARMNLREKGRGNAFQLGFQSKTKGKGAFEARSSTKRRFQKVKKKTHLRASSGQSGGGVAPPVAGPDASADATELASAKGGLDGPNGAEVPLANVDGGAGKEEDEGGVRRPKSKLEALREAWPGAMTLAAAEVRPAKVLGLPSVP